MSRIRSLLTLALLLIAGCVDPASAFETAARTAVVVDHRTNAVLFAKSVDESIPPASMSKLMTAYLVFERLKQGRLKLDDQLLVSEKAWRIAGSEMFVKVGDRVRVEDLVRGMIVQSGNDACIVLAEGLTGSEEAMAEQANAKARELGLHASSFTNVTGLPDLGHRTSARDLATLAGRLIRDFPEYYSYYSEKEYEYAGIRQPNRNPLLQAGVPGVDGVKTGHTEEAGYGLVASAFRDGRRLTMVVSGLSSMQQRRTESEKLLEYAFREFQEFRLYAPGQTVAETGVWQGAVGSVSLVSDDGVAVSLTRAARDSMVVKARYDSPVAAPVSRGQPLGELWVTAPGVEPLRVPLVAGADVPRAGMLGRLTGMVSYLVLGPG